MNDVLSTFPHPYSWPAHKAMMSAHRAGQVSDAEWASYRAAVKADPTSRLNWYKAASPAPHEDHEAAYLNWIDRETAAQPLTVATVADTAPY